MMVLPWPGRSACAAPNPMASTRAIMRTGNETWLHVASRAKAAPLIPGLAPPTEASERAGAGPLSPGPNDTVAAVAASGFDSRAVG
jgi:hypothetical protein